MLYSQFIGNICTFVDSFKFAYFSIPRLLNHSLFSPLCRAPLTLRSHRPLKMFVKCVDVSYGTVTVVTMHKKCKFH